MERRLEYNSDILGVVEGMAEEMGDFERRARAAQGTSCGGGRAYPHLDYDTQAPQ